MRRRGQTLSAVRINVQLLRQNVDPGEAPRRFEDIIELVRSWRNDRDDGRAWIRSWRFRLRIGRRARRRRHRTHKSPSSRRQHRCDSPTRYPDMDKPHFKFGREAEHVLFYGEPPFATACTPRDVLSKRRRPKKRRSSRRMKNSIAR